MKSISFKNFRRFADFPVFKFGDITILVGGNNAGKSTLQKALLLVFDNLRSLKGQVYSANSFENGFISPQFRFDANDIHDLNLGTFCRSLNAKALEKVIEFTLCISNFDIKVLIEPNKEGENLPVAKLALIEIKDIKRHILYSFNFNTLRMRVEFEKIQGNGDPKFDRIQERISELRETIASETDPFEAAMENEELEKLLKVRNAFIKNAEELQESYTAETDLKEYLGIKGFDRVTHGRLASYIENIDAYASTIDSRFVQSFEFTDDGEFIEKKHETEEVWNGSEEDIANKQVLDDKRSLLLESAQALESELRRPHVYYIQAHGVSQKMLYTIDDKNDFVAQAIHQYARRGVHPGDMPDTFVRRWMSIFEIGSNYRISSIGGEGYIVEIETEGGWVNLADLGMGANQIMVLLFSLATIMFEEGYHTKEKGGVSHVPKFIIIEEPEQNLHPFLQSKLADLVAEINNNDPSYKFLIETHSEYLIRRTQVLVAEMGLGEEELENQNPFKVYYFPTNGTPYDMKYLPTGRFENKFGEGFFDESARWHMEILKKEKSRK